MRSLLFLIPATLVISSPGSHAVEAPSMKITAADLKIDGKLGTFKASWDIQQKEAGLMLATLTLEAPKAATPPAIDIKWSAPAINVTGTWVSDATKQKIGHGVIKVDSRAVRRAPVLMFMDPDDINRFTVSLSDSLRPAQLMAFVREEDCRLYMKASLFQEKHEPISKYQITLRFDTRPSPYYSILRDTTRWWAKQKNYTPSAVPEAARIPVYSTWYSYHQNVTADSIAEECRLGGKLGLKGVIIDDGWQTLDSARGYAYTGDWKPERIPDMKALADRIHALGQKILIWYSVPMVGEKSQAIHQFKDKTLFYSKGFGAYVLDPRYPEVREYLITTYEKAVKDWDLDGLKLDFIGMFSPRPNTVFTAENGRDHASIDQAVDRLMTDIMSRLRAIKPDIAIEFRQPYNGPLMRKYGNMLRAVDCPNSAPVNRKHIVDLRLIADNTAVHSDMVMWHPDAPVESAALQILNILFSVPQISVRLAEIPEDHRQMIGFWMNYWLANRSVLLDGKFQPASPSHNYPKIVGRTADKYIAALYQNLVVSPGPSAPAHIDVVNAKPSNSNVVVRFDENYGQASVTIFDTTGKKVSSSTQSLNAGAHSWQVPASGLLQIEKRVK